MAEPASHPLATIMVPTYGQADVLGRAISSALAQDLESLEVIVVDDASPDATADVVARFEDPRLRYHRNATNLGRVANYRQTLYELARGKYVLNLDGDDWLIDPTFVRRAVELMESNPDLVLTFANAWRHREDTGQYFSLGGQNEGLEAVNSGTEIFLRYPTQEVWIPHLTAVYRRADAMGIGFYQNDIIGSDTDSLLRLIIGRQVGFVPGWAAVWSFHEANATGSLDVGARVANLACADEPYETARRLGTVDPDRLRRWRTAMRERLCLEFIRRAVRSRQFGAVAVFMRETFKRSPAAALDALKASVGYVIFPAGRRRLLPVMRELSEEGAA